MCLAPCLSAALPTYNYDLAGNVTGTLNSISNSQSPQIGLTNSYDGAGRLSSVQSSWVGDSLHPDTLFKADLLVPVLQADGTTASVSPYGPFGLTAAQLAYNSTSAVAAMVQTRSYDNRGRIISSMTLGSAPQPTSAGAIQITPNPISQGVTAIATNTCGPSCGTGEGEWFIDGAVASNSGFTYIAGQTRTWYINPGLAVGSHNIQVKYSGDSTHPALSSDLTSFTVIPNQLPTPSIIPSISPSSVPSGESATVSVTLGLCGSSCGTGYFSIDGVSVGALNFDENGVASNTTRNDLSIGTHTLGVHYDGNANYSYADASMSFTVVPDTLPVPTFQVSISPNSIPAGEYAMVTITANCNSACGGGQVFVDGNYAGGYVLHGVGSNQTFMNFTSLPVGPHNLSITYTGNTSFGPTSSDTNPFQVVTNNLPVPTITVSVPSLTFMVPYGATTVPLGTVTIQGSCTSTCGSAAYGEILVDGTYACSFTLDSTGSNTINCATTNLAVGEHQLTALFAGNTSWKQTLSAPLAIDVQEAPAK